MTSPQQHSIPVTERDSSGRLTEVGTSLNVQTSPSLGGKPALQPGSRFGRYQIEQLLGEGAMGAVFLARDEALQRPVALKVPKFSADDEEGRLRFLREARSAAALRHPGICPIYDVGEIDGTQYLTMPFIEGQSLARRLASESRFPEREAAALIRKLALALQAAHAASIIHRDLKPANVMIDRSGEPVVMDFGLARTLEEDAAGRITHSGAVVGSPAYMSPEQAQARMEEMGPASDIYSLGVILYELLAGRLPFTGPLYQLLTAIIHDPPPPLRPVRPDLDPRIEAICVRMLAKSPASRFTSMGDVAAAVEELLSDVADKTSAPEAADHIAAGSTQVWTGEARSASLSTTSLRSHASHEPIARRKSRWIAIAIPFGVGTALLAAGLLWSFTRGNPEDKNNPAVDFRRTGSSMSGGQNASLSEVANSARNSLTDSTIKRSSQDPSVALTERSGSELNGPQSTSDHPSSLSTTSDSPNRAAVAHHDDVSGSSGPAIETTTNSLGMKFVRIPAGEYQRGSPSSDKDAQMDEKPQHRVRITHDFLLGLHEVTRGQFRQFAEVSGYETDAERDGNGGVGFDLSTGGFSQKPRYNWKNPGFEQSDDHPVVEVTWNDATAFCEWLSNRDKKVCRLPTEAEWEYACRAGTTSRFQTGDDPEKLAPFANISDGTARAKFPTWTTLDARDGHVVTAPVGSLKPNRFGLFDMHGNVSEWCADWHGADEYARYINETAVDPLGAEIGSNRVTRGGGWCFSSEGARSANRNWVEPDFRSCFLGFRVAVTIPAQDRE